MTHEIKELILAYQQAALNGLSCVMATVVHLDGSSYRRPGVRMLINEQGQMTGAVSGGCVEKEILRQSHSVFKTGTSKMMSYDGRYRLGCEGTLYILIERFSPSKIFLECFEQAVKERTSFEIVSIYSLEVGEDRAYGSKFIFGKQHIAVNRERQVALDQTDGVKAFKQQMEPCFKLIIFGAEHDTGQLALMAGSLGWEVTVVVSPSSGQTIDDFKGAQELLKQNAEGVDLKGIDKNVAVVLMTHSYAKDLSYLYALKDSRPAYIGLLGPSNRRERILNDILEKFPDLENEFFDLLFGPAGLNIGSETPQEIAMSICSEILSVIRGQEPKPLKDKLGKIHLNIKL